MGLENSSRQVAAMQFSKCHWKNPGAFILKDPLSLSHTLVHAWSVLTNAHALPVLDSCHHIEDHQAIGGLI